jgi:V/A-type H+-transporting ATPase subunit E
MTGLEKIIKMIDDEAQASADAILAEAKREAEDIISAAKIEADMKCKQIAEKSEAEIKDVLDRAESAAALYEKKLLLNTKQQLINGIIASARNRLTSISNVEYTDIILTLVNKYAHNKEGTILFSKADRKRLTADFPERMKHMLATRPGAALKLEDREPSFEGGFLLIYGDVEENCSFDALFADKRDVLLDKVNSLLFD